MVEKTTETVS